MHVAWFHSRHNVNYWHSGDYLGLGAGAHSYRRDDDGVTGQRWNNEKSPAKYMTQIDDTRQAVVERESIDAHKAAAEFMFLGLRMTEGIRADAFRQRFGQTARQFYPQIDTWIEGELLVEQGEFLRFTAKGLMLANSIFVHFM